jgi:hypothetical protein
VATVAVSFIDDLQAVRRDEIGNSDEIERLAEQMGAEVYEERLETQFRTATGSRRGSPSPTCGPARTVAWSRSGASTPPRGSGSTTSG